MSKPKNINEDIEFRLSVSLKAIEDGDADPLAVACETFKLEKTIKAFNEKIKAMAFDQAEQYGEKTFSAFGRVIEIRNGGQSLTYADDPVYKEMKDRIKSREEVLKTAFKSSETIFDSEGVEVPKVGCKQRANSLVIK